MRIGHGRMLFSVGLAGLLTLIVAGPAHAVDGVIEINQASAKVGGITLGDTPLFPVTLSQSGSYRLTSDLNVTDATARAAGVNAENTTAIKVTADYVTIDLNGFSIIGPAVCTPAGFTTESCSPTGTGFGITDVEPPDGQTHTTVLNGTIRGMGSIGINLELGIEGRVERMHVVGNGSFGMAIGDGCTVRETTVSRNLGSGISVHDGCSVIDNVANWNKLAGIGTENGSTVIGNTVSNNGSQGMALGGRTGYANNVISLNTGTVTGGINMGHNVCDLVLCP